MPLIDKEIPEEILVIANNNIMCFKNDVTVMLYKTDNFSHYRKPRTVRQVLARDWQRPAPPSGGKIQCWNGAEPALGLPQ